MKITPMRAAAAVIVAGLLVILAGLLVGDSPTPATTAPVAVDLEIVPHPEDGAEVVRGAPGSREQLVLFGGLLIAFGTLGLLGSKSAEAAKRARQQRDVPSAPREPSAA